MILNIFGRLKNRSHYSFPGMWYFVDLWRVLWTFTVRAVADSPLEPATDFSETPSTITFQPMFALDASALQSTSGEIHDSQGD
jgi:hypothetical protein